MNTLKNFENPCYITKLVTEWSEGVKIIDTYNIGKDDLINVEVEIYNIVNKENKYVVNIISQELRFEKKLIFIIQRNLVEKRTIMMEKKRIMMEFLIF